MARIPFKLPDIGEGIAEAEIVAWHVKVGDEVVEGQALADVMTDKATVELSAPLTGTITARKGELGSKARVGEELVVFETRGEPPAPPEPPPGVSAIEKPSARTAPLPVMEERRPVGDGTKVLAAPAVRARAEFLKLDLATLAGSGPQGRILHEDLDRLLQKRPHDEPRAGITVPPGGEEIPVFGLRRKIAERMEEAHRRIPHVTYVEEVDVTELERLRQELNQSSGLHLTLLPFLILAMAKAVPRHPKINAHYDDRAAVIHRYAELHVGIATQTERGLLVPVIRNAQTLDAPALAQRIAELGDAARSGKSRREDLTGSTITITSLGTLGGIAATPLINPPEVAIIGVNRVAERPVVRDGGIVIRKMMNLSSSFDHRVIDGFDAAAFIQSVKTELERPEGLAAAGGQAA